MPTDDEFTNSMRRYHQQRREFVIAQLTSYEAKRVRKREIEEMMIQCVQTAQMMAGQIESMPINIPLR